MSLHSDVLAFLQHIDHQRLVNYIQKFGWEYTSEHDLYTLYEHPDAKLEQLLVPHPICSDYTKRVFEVLDTIASFHQENWIHILQDFNLA